MCFISSTQLFLDVKGLAEKSTIRKGRSLFILVNRSYTVLLKVKETRIFMDFHFRYFFILSNFLEIKITVPSKSLVRNLTGYAKFTGLQGPLSPGHQVSRFRCRRKSKSLATGLWVWRIGHTSSLWAWNVYFTRIMN